MMSFKSQPAIRKGAVVPNPIVKLRPLSDCNQECNLLNRRVSRRSQLQTGSKITGVVIGNGDTISSTNHSTGKVFTTLNTVDKSGCIGNSYDSVDSKINKSADTSQQQVKGQINPQIYSQVKPQIYSQVNPQIYSQVNPQIYSQVRPQIYSQVNPQIYSQVNPQINSQVNPQMNSCHHCNEGFQPQEPMVNLNGLVWHKQCFVCAQCFQQFSDDLFFEFGGRLYCGHDFQILFAPFCTSCKEFIMGRVIKAMNGYWHPQCFRCNICMTQLADVGFVRSANRALCKTCNEEERTKRIGKHVCAKCNNVIEETELLKYKGEVFHPYHFRCHTCSCELTLTAREKDKELYCLRCHDKLGIPICGACRRPIEERVIHALGKTWHVEHFVCSHCEKPFLGSRHYEKKGLAYCEIHYHQLFGNTCFHCNNVITGNAFNAFNKNWCENHFACFGCNHKMDHKTKFMEFDGKPVCKNCYKKFPSEFLKRHKKESSGKK